MTNIVETKFLSFSQAIELTSEGIPVSAQHWDFIDRVTGFNTTHFVNIPQIWLPENRRVSALMYGTESIKIPVTPYLTKMTKKGIENYIPTNTDMFAKWMYSDHVLRLSGTYYDREESDTCCLTFKRLRPSQEGTDYRLEDIYDSDMIGYHDRVMFIHQNTSSAKILATIYNMASEAINNRNLTEFTNSFEIDDEFLEEDTWLEDCSLPAIHYKLVKADEHIFEKLNSIPLDRPINIILDYDSLSDSKVTEDTTLLDKLEYTLKSIESPNLKWTSISLSKLLSKV